MTRKRNLNLEQTSNYQDQNLPLNFQSALSVMAKMRSLELRELFRMF